ncbi:MAG: hypothetical protein J0M20_06055 [Burkholderiales bacterium]|nr:hypothetical protein [Burkholderiales bacterium]
MVARVRPASARAVDVLLNAGLQAHRDGQFKEWTGQRHRRLAARLEHPWLALVLGTIAAATPAANRRALAQRALLVWAMSQLRPDHLSGLQDIAPQAWLQSTSWRPLLALACHHGFLAIPDFPSHYRRRAGESAVDNLCGLWSVVPSTLYRYMEKGRQQMGEVFLSREPSGELMLSLRETTWRLVSAELPPVEDRRAWHREQAEQALAQARATDALWHATLADDFELSLQVVRRHSLALAATEEADVMLARWRQRRSDAFSSFELALGTAALWRHRQDPARENEQLQVALRTADASGRGLLLGRAYAALGRFHMQRDPDRTQACYEDAIRLLRAAVDDRSDESAARHAGEELARVLIHLAWTHILRDDPKGLPLLEQVDQLARQSPLPDDIQAEAEQTWGEYWRRSGDLQRALQHKQRALNIYERLGDQRSMLSTCNNLSLLYAEARDLDRALHYGYRVLEAAANTRIEPLVLAGAELHVGIAHFYRNDFDGAIHHYLRALKAYDLAGSKGRTGACHYNLAEAYFHRFARSGDADDERLGDQHAGIALRLGQQEQRKGWAESVGNLKGSVLGGAQAQIDRLLPEEVAEHFVEMREVQAHRKRLAMPGLAAAEQASIRLQVARAYLAIAVREREAALTLARKHGLGERFDEELTAMRRTFERTLSWHEQVTARWEQVAADLLAPERREAVLARLFEQGALSKSVYASLSGMGLATASKHLGLLASRGLLLQSGRGPATRYRLPDSPDAKA